MNTTHAAEVDRNTVLGKVVLVLQAFGAEDNSVSLADLQRRTALAKATLHRLVTDLVEVRLLERTASGYRLGGRLFEIGLRASSERRLREAAIPFLQDLYARTGETVHLGVRDGAEVVYLDKIGGHRQACAPSRVGGRMPLHCTAIGKALLAYAGPALLAEVLGAPLSRLTSRTITAPGVLRQNLARIVQTGSAFEFEESAAGIVCVAAPVIDADGHAVAAISVTGPVTRFRPEAHAASVRAAADGLAAALGHPVLRPQRVG